MASRNNPLNVYKGDDALRDFFDPDKQPLLPLVELPAGLNPFRRDGVRIYAKLLTALPAQNVKALPGMCPCQCLATDKTDGSSVEHAPEKYGRR